MFVSVISLVVAVEHGRTMERMAEANERMVEIPDGRSARRTNPWRDVRLSNERVQVSVLPSWWQRHVAAIRSLGV